MSHNHSPFQPFGKNNRIKNQPPARDELADRLARSRFADALATGVTGVVDHFGTRIEKDHMVLFMPPAQHHLWQVKDILPALEPNVPVGVVRVVLECTIPLMASAGSQIPTLVVYGKALAEGHMQIGPPRAGDATGDAEDAAGADAVNAAAGVEDVADAANAGGSDRAEAEAAMEAEQRFATEPQE